MIGSAVVTTKGQVTVPLSVREYLSIVPGTRLNFEVDVSLGEIKVRKASKSSLDEVYGALHTDKKYIGLDKIRDKIAKDIAIYYEKKLVRNS
jgi:AbrB family looped-hinge helix DNA binding protein